MPRDPEKQRAAKRRHYEKNKQDYLERNRQYRRTLLDIVRDSKSRPCMDCGETFPFYVMDLHHRDGKEGTVDYFVKFRSRFRLLEEIAKCDVVCANCHRIRTWG